MAAYLLDSSAIVKRYVNEAGSAWVAGLVDPSAGHRIHLAGITGVEVVSAITRRQRGGSIAPADAALVLAAFRRDFARAYLVVDISPAHIAHAMDLAQAHALRGYDAVQLAVALDVSAIAGASGEAFTFVSADAALLAAAHAELLPVENPSAHP